MAMRISFVLMYTLVLAAGKSLIESTANTKLINIFFADSVQIFPSGDYVVALMQNALFTCVTQQNGGVNIQWLLNETVIRPNATTVTMNTELEIRNVSVAFNQSRIACHAEFSSGNNLTSLVTRLIIQGTVKNLWSDSSYIIL